MIMAKINEFKIEKDIPFPQQSKELKYPFKTMEIGDSFFVPCKGLDEQKKIQCSILSRANYFKLRLNLNVKFTSSVIKGGVRIWRIK